jgi:hypothetical protein
LGQYILNLNKVQYKNYSDKSIIIEMSEIETHIKELMRILSILKGKREIFVNKKGYDSIISVLEKELEACRSILEVKQ